MCTSLRITAMNGAVIVGRTMEYPLEVNWELRAVPRGVVQTSVAPDGTGMSWEANYGYVGLGIGATNSLGLSIDSQLSLPDGVNEKGLYAGLLYLPSFTQYEDPAIVPADRLIAPLDLANYVLATSSTVRQAVAAIEKATVWAAPMPVIGVPPLHLVLHDRTGDAAVIEWVGGERQVHDNPIGVATNSPPFDWHLVNLRNYVNQTAVDVPTSTIGGTKISPMGEGSGMLGLPGDFTPPSRFVRAVEFASTARPPETQVDGTSTVMHLLSSFDITKGVIRDANPAGLTVERAEAVGDFTSFRTVAALGPSPAYTVQTYDDAAPRRVELHEVDLSGGPVRCYQLPPLAPEAVSF
jgi:choloylglycine hydrolase